MSIASNTQQKGIQIVLRKRKKLRIVQNLNSSNYASFSLWDRGQIDIKLGTKHVIDLKLANFTYKKDIYVNRIGSVSLACKCVFYRPERNAKEGPHIIGF